MYSIKNYTLDLCTLVFSHFKHTPMWNASNWPFHRAQITTETKKQIPIRYFLLYISYFSNYLHYLLLVENWNYKFKIQQVKVCLVCNFYQSVFNIRWYSAQMSLVTFWNFRGEGFQLHLKYMSSQKKKFIPNKPDASIGKNNTMYHQIWF